MNGVNKMFTGFTDETFEFFMAIRFNNNREFFQGEHDWYLRAVRQPALDLADSLTDTIEYLDEDLERRPNKVVSRINRDIRFSRDKSPYRDYMWIAYRKSGVPHGSTIGVYFDISDRGASCGMGFYDENRPLMTALRRYLENDPTEFLELWDEIKDEFTLFPKSYKRMKIPDTIPEEAKQWYNLQGFYVEKELDDRALLKSSQLADVLNDSFRRLKPMYDFFKSLSVENGGNV